MRTLAITCVLLAACGRSDEPGKQDPAKHAPAGGAQPAAPTPTPAPPAANDRGACKVTVTGGATATIESPGGMSAAQVSYWMDEKTRANLFPKGEVGMVINCIQGADSISIMTGSESTPQTVPKGPMKYTLDGQLPQTGIFAVGMLGDIGLMNPKGTIEITAFDDTHIAGTIHLTAKTMPDTGEAKIAGSFDYKK